TCAERGVSSSPNVTMRSASVLRSTSARLVTISATYSPGSNPVDRPASRHSVRNARLVTPAMGASTTGVATVSGPISRGGSTVVVSGAEVTAPFSHRPPGHLLPNPAARVLNGGADTAPGVHHRAPAPGGVEGRGPPDTWDRPRHVLSLDTGDRDAGPGRHAGPYRHDHRRHPHRDGRRLDGGRRGVLPAQPIRRGDLRARRPHILSVRGLGHTHAGIRVQATGEPQARPRLACLRVRECWLRRAPGLLLGVRVLGERVRGPRLLLDPHRVDAGRRPPGA